MANSFGPSSIKVPSEASYEKGMDGKKSYTDLLKQGVSRAQDGRGAEYSEHDHRAMGHRGGTAQASVPSSDTAGQVSSDIPVPATGESGLISAAKPAKNFRIPGQTGKSGPR